MGGLAAEVGFAATADGGFILPAFLPAFGAAAAMVKMPSCWRSRASRCPRWWAGCRRSTSPRDRRHPWDQKGTVMRTLVELSKDREVDLIDGVKVRHGDGWALALPDPEEPITHIWAEQRSRSRQLARSTPPDPPAAEVTRGAAQPRPRIGGRGQREVLRQASTPRRV